MDFMFDIVTMIVVAALALIIKVASMTPYLVVWSVMWIVKLLRLVVF